MHLNVPPKGASGFPLIVLRFGAMLATMLALEVTLQWALIEWRQVEGLTKKMVELQAEINGNQFACTASSSAFESTKA